MLRRHHANLQRNRKRVENDSGELCRFVYRVWLMGDLLLSQYRHRIIMTLTNAMHRLSAQYQL